MIYKDTKAYLEGYVGYLTLETGLDYRLKWNKQLRQFELYRRQASFFDLYAHNVLLEFEVANLQKYCVINTKNINNYNMFVKINNKLDQKVNFGSFGKNVSLQCKILAENHEELVFVLETLEECGYFNRESD